MSQIMTAHRREFTRALDIAASVADRHARIPILETIKVTANGKLRLDATDLDTSAVVEMPYSGVGLAPFALRGAKQVARSIKQVGGDTVDLAFAGEGKDARVQIASGALSASINTLPADEFPVMKVIAVEEFGCDLGAAELAQIARVMPAISLEERRYYLNGIAMERIGEWLWRFVATDGHRLMIVDVPLPGAQGDVPPRTIIPRRFILKVMQHFAKSKDAVRLSYGRAGLPNRPENTLAPEAKGSPRIAFAGSAGGLGLTLTSKLIDGVYPDYARVIPNGVASSVRMNRAELLAAIRALTPFSTTRTRAVRLDAREAGIRVSLECHDLGGAHVDVAAEHGFPAGHKIASFNGEYLVDCLTGFTGEEIDFQWPRDDTAGDPCTLRDPADTAFFCVLMPMRV
jgi:DNA polymerase-3 subunit beta